MRALAKGVLALYPLAYRRRYGDEMRGLLDDSEVGAWTVLDLAKGAALAHLRPLPGLERAVPAEERLRAGAVALLACWLLVTLAGLGFYKTTENYSAAGKAHPLLGSAHLAVKLAAMVGALAVAAAIVPLAAVALRRAMRGERQARSAAMLATLCSAALVLASGGVVAAAQLGSPLSARAAVAIFGGWTLIALAAGVACIVAARRGIAAIPIGRNASRALVALGAVAAAAIVAITAAAAVYLAALLADAPALGSAANGPDGILTVTASLAIQLGAIAIAAALAVRAARAGHEALAALEPA